MSNRTIKTVTVIIRHVDRNDDHPGQNWLVSLSTGAIFDLVVASFEGEQIARNYALILAERNDWSLK